MSDATAVVDTDVPPDTRLQLIIQHNAEGQVDATVAVRWCVSMQLVDELRTRGFQRPMLLLVVRSPKLEGVGYSQLTTYNETAARVIPLTQELDFVSFRRSGKNEIRAVIVDAEDADKLDTLRSIARLNDGDIFHTDGSLTTIFAKNKLNYINVKSYVEVDVPLKMFAKPPREWTSKMIKRFLTDREVDECDRRWDLILATICAVLLLTIGQVIKITAFVFAMLFGLRGINWGEMLHPWKGEILAPVADCEKSIWFYKKGYSSQARWTPLLTINPIIVFVAPAIVFVFMQWSARDKSGTDVNWHNWHAHLLTYPGWWDTVWMVDLAIVCLTAAVCILVLIVYGVGELDSKIKGSESRRQRKQRAKNEAEQRKLSAAQYQKQQMLSTLEAMTCSTGAKVASLSALPKDKQTITLKFYDFKVKVCKPFAR